MGEKDIATSTDAEEQRNFMRALLEDVQALDRMIGEGRIESGVRRIGAEQEMFLVDSGMRPMCVADRVLDELRDPAFTSELALFNLEANLSPCRMGTDCLQRMEGELEVRLAQVRAAAEKHGAKVLLFGILPTLGKEHLTLEQMTPDPRYHELNRVLSEYCSGEFHTLIKGLDELKLVHDNLMLEACNTSFQVHFQVSSEEFAALYNVAQAVTAPVLAAAVNSPLLLRHRLWHETRVALFQQSLDNRSETQKERGKRQRVYFGDRWVEDSVLEIFRDDITRFRAIIRGRLDESPLTTLDRDEIPNLRALCLHNGTIYRWNRPCYGVRDGVAHLRIENRVLPAGPTVLDEVANAAFFFGLMSALDEEYGDIKKAMSFDEVKENFMAAARYGLKARFRWVGGMTWTAEDLILQHLLPLARDGLTRRGVDPKERDRYLDVIGERVARGRTGAQWALDSFAGMEEGDAPGARMRAICAATEAQQWSGKPVHQWELATLEVDDRWQEDYRLVSQLMTTDVITVHPEDLIDLAASVMEWEKIRQVPVEDTDGKLVGILSHRAILRLVARGIASGEMKNVSVREVMAKDPITCIPETTSLDAIALMRQHGVSSLPVIRDGQMVGIISEHDFINVAARLLEERLRES